MRFKTAPHSRDVSLRNWEDDLNLFFSRAIVLALLALLGPGCGSNHVTSSPATKGDTVPAAANRRIRFKEEYKQMLGKDGKMLWTPSTTNKRPPGVAGPEPPKTEN
jgi:hypothetical protein